MSWARPLKFMDADRKSFAVQLVAPYLFLLTMLQNKLIRADWLKTDHTMPSGDLLWISNYRKGKQVLQFYTAWFQL